MYCLNSGLITFAILFASFCTAYSLDCYECSNMIDDKCGNEWMYDENESENIRMPCNGTACRKFEWRDSRLDTLVVVRDCWSKGELNADEMTCTEYPAKSKVCYCAGQTCNGKQLLRSEIGIVLLVLLPLIHNMFYR